MFYNTLALLFRGSTAYLRKLVLSRNAIKPHAAFHSIEFYNYSYWAHSVDSDNAFSCSLRYLKFIEANK